MFPLYNNFGKVVGFTGRVMPGNESADVGKYVNSPETPVFNKSKLLFGFFKTKNNIRETNTTVLVEGQMDFLMAWQDGIKNLVATSGTALTADHLKTLRRLSENIVLSFDNDSAGRAAAERTIDLAEAHDYNVKVILFKDKELKDPADIVRAKPGHFEQLISAAVPAMEYYFDFYGISRNQDIAAKKKSIRSALAKIKVISSPIEQQHWLNKLTTLSGVPEVALTAEMAAIKVNPVTGLHDAEQTVLDQPQAQLGRLDLIVRRLISLMLIDESLVKEIEAEKQLIPAQYLPILTFVMKDPKASPPADLAPVINLLYLESSLGDPTKAKTEWAELMIRLRGEYHNFRKNQLKIKITEAEKTRNEPELQKLLGEYRNLISGDK